MDEITAHDLRRFCEKANPANREECFICHKHKGITHLHHVLPLNECAKWMNTGYVDTVNIPRVWLCPNCHSYVHAVMKHHRFWELMSVYTEEEYKRMTTVLGMRHMVEDELYQRIPKTW